MDLPVDYYELYSSPETRRLKVLCYSLMAISFIFLSLFFLLVIKTNQMPIQFETVSFPAMHIIDILLAIMVLRLINDARLNRTPSAKKQLSYLLVTYLSLFSLILHFVFLYMLFNAFYWLYMFAALISFGKSIFTFLALALIIINTLLVPLLQINSFKFVKTLRQAGDIQITGNQEPDNE